MSDRDELVKKLLSDRRKEQSSMKESFDSRANALEERDNVAETNYFPFKDPSQLY